MRAQSRIAVVGGGGAGLLCARLLSRSHNVTLFEREDRIGGNARHDIQGSSRLDLGVNVFHKTAYPNFFAVAKKLGIRSVPCNLTIRFGLNDRVQATYDYNRQQLQMPQEGALSSVRNIILRSKITRFVDFYLKTTPKSSFGELIRALPVSPKVKLMLRGLCMGVWTMRSQDVDRFPAVFVVNELKSLGLQLVDHQGQWHCLEGGVSGYLDALRIGCNSFLQLNEQVATVERKEDRILVCTPKGNCFTYDEVVLATPGDIAYRLVKNPNRIEREILPAFESVCHPISLRCLPGGKDSLVSPTAIELYLRKAAGGEYETERAITNLHSLTNGILPKGYFLSHSQAELDSGLMGRLYSWTGYTPQITAESIQAAQRHQSVSGVDRIHYCGSYWGNGLHEAAVTSAIQVANAFGIGLESI